MGWKGIVIILGEWNQTVAWFAKTNQEFVQSVMLLEKGLEQDIIVRLVLVMFVLLVAMMSIGQFDTKFNDKSAEGIQSS